MIPLFLPINPKKKLSNMGDEEEKYPLTLASQLKNLSSIMFFLYSHFLLFINMKEQCMGKCHRNSVDLQRAIMKNLSSSRNNGIRCHVMGLNEVLLATNNFLKT